MPIREGNALSFEVWRTDGFYPVCGHNFWDSDGGANVVCKAFGFTSGKLAYNKMTYDKRAIRVGKCEPTDRRRDSGRKVGKEGVMVGIRRVGRRK